VSALNSQTITYGELASVLDHSLLRPELIDADVIAGCQLADRCQITTAYVKPCHVKLASATLKDSTVKVGTTVGFPHGAHITSVKVAEARQAIDDRAVELDMVLNIGDLRSGKADAVCADIRAVCDTAHERGAKVKVFLENAYLTDRQKVLGCKLAEEAVADRGKTSTGFASVAQRSMTCAWCAGRSARKSRSRPLVECAHWQPYWMSRMPERIAAEPLPPPPSSTRSK
jgi:deoxyribose-phosphate aldolase